MCHFFLQPHGTWVAQHKTPMSSWPAPRQRWKNGLNSSGESLAHHPEVRTLQAFLRRCLWHIRNDWRDHSLKDLKEDQRTALNHGHSHGHGHGHGHDHGQVLCWVGTKEGSTSLAFLLGYRKSQLKTSDQLQVASYPQWSANACETQSHHFSFVGQSTLTCEMHRLDSPGSQHTDWCHSGDLFSWGTWGTWEADSKICNLGWSAQEKKSCCPEVGRLD